MNKISLYLQATNFKVGDTVKIISSDNKRLLNSLGIIFKIDKSSPTPVYVIAIDGGLGGGKGSTRKFSWEIEKVRTKTKTIKYENGKIVLKG